MQTGKNKNLSIILFLLIFVLAFVGLFGRNLWTPDEPREAAISLEMAKENNFLLPKLAGMPFVEKPPLFYIIGATLINLFQSFIGTTAALKLIPLFSYFFTLYLVFLLAKMLLNEEYAFNAMAVLAALPGFIHITHWLITDCLLMLFCLLAIYFITKSYIQQRWRFLLLAAIAAGLAFWVKGIIAIIFIFLGWIGLLVAYWRKKDKKELFKKKSILWHIVSCAVLFVMMTSWPALLYKIYGKDLFLEWFVQNHLGRFAGTSTQLGHINRNPFYYIGVLMIYLLPFLYHFILGLKLMIKKGSKEFSFLDMLFISYGLGGLLILSISSTKREIYLAPLLPVYGLFITASMDKAIGKIHQLWLNSCNRLLFIVLLGMPLLLWLYREKSLALCGLIAVCSYLALNYFLSKDIAFTNERKFLINWLIVAICLLTFATVILDKMKNYERHFVAFSKRVEKIQKECVLWKPDETTRACFYYYAGMTFPIIETKEELKSILSSASYFVIALNRSFPAGDSAKDLPEWQVVYEQTFGATHKPRKLTLIKGKEEGKTESR